MLIFPVQLTTSRIGSFMRSIHTLILCVCDIYVENEQAKARRVRPYRPASACSFSTPKLNHVLTHRGISPDFRGVVHLFI